jgi:hypothetical protein
MTDLSTDVNTFPLPRRGRPPKLDPNIIVENLEPKQPDNLSVKPTLGRADQVGFAYMARGLEILNGIASCPDIPVAMRQRAAEMMVENGAAMFKGRKGNGKDLPPPPPHFRTESMPPSDASSPLGSDTESIPDGWGEEVAVGPEDDIPEFPPDPLPPPPTDRNFAQDAQIKKRCEERVLRMLAKYRVCKVPKLKGAVMGDRFGEPPLMDLDLLLRDLLAKGVIAKHTDTAGRVSYYLKGRPPLPLPTFRAQS